MPTLSVVMIVKNEAGCLADCLDSVREIADEIIVADTGSTDNTIEIAHQYGSKVHEIEWRDDFAQARNESLELATGDWLLHIDADEALDADGASEIRRIVDGDGLGADAIELTLANYCDDPRAWRWTPAEPDDAMARGRSGYIAVELLRLFRNGRGFEYREPVHENITESVRERGGVVRAEPITIHHYGYDSDAGQPNPKAEFYLKIARSKVEQRPQDPKAWYDLGEQLLACEKTDEAEEACRRTLELSPIHLGSATTLANILLMRGDFDEAKELLLKLESGGVSAPHIGMTLGAIACRDGRLDEAKRRLEAVLDIQPKNIMAILYLARTFDRLGMPDKARESLDAAMLIAPGLDEINKRVRAHELREKGEAVFNDGAQAESMQVLVEALQLDNEDPFIHNDLGVILAAMGDLKRAQESFERALLLAPGLSDAEQNLAAMQAQSN